MSARMYANTGQRTSTGTRGTAFERRERPQGRPLREGEPTGSTRRKRGRFGDDSLVEERTPGNRSERVDAVGVCGPGNRVGVVGTVGTVRTGQPGRIGSTKGIARRSASSDGRLSCSSRRLTPGDRSTVDHHHEESPREAHRLAGTSARGASIFGTSVVVPGSCRPAACRRTLGLRCRVERTCGCRRAPRGRPTPQPRVIGGSSVTRFPHRRSRGC